VKANLLDDGVVDTLGSVGATSGVHTSVSINASDSANPLAQHSFVDVAPLLAPAGYHSRGVLPQRPPIFNHFEEQFTPAWRRVLFRH
jgi:hypothetical protein